MLRRNPYLRELVVMRPSFFQMVPGSLFWAWFLLSSFSAGSLQAHRVTAVSLISFLNTEEKTYVLDVAMEVMPSEDLALNDQISPEDAAREFAEEYLVVMFDREDQKPTMEIHLEDASDEDTPPELQRQQVLTKLTGTIPEGAKEFLLYLDPNCPMAVVMVVIKDEQPSRRMQVILAGEYSRPVSVSPLAEGDPFGEDDAPVPVAALESKGPGERGESAGRAPSNPGLAALLAGARGYFRDGGLSFALLVGVLLLTLERRALLLQGLALLVMQSLAVSLVAWGGLPIADWSSVALMLLIAGLALEAFFHACFGWWRLPLVAVAGFFSGLEIAGGGAFRAEVAAGGFRSSEVVAFIAGAEVVFVLAGLAVAAALIASARLSRYRSLVVQPLSAVVAGYVLYCLVEGYL